MDFIENPVSKEKDYTKKVWEMFDKLKVLDGLDKDGEECLSEVEDEGDYEGEGELGLEYFIDPQELTEEERKKLEEQGFVFDEAEGEYDDEAEGEGDEAEGDEAEGDAGEPEEGDKKKRTRNEDGDEAKGKNKRQKTEE